MNFTGQAENTKGSLGSAALDKEWSNVGHEWARMVKKIGESLA
jgi:hypothetical protein